MEHVGWIAIILSCVVFADSLLIRGKLKDQDRRIRDLENSTRGS